LRIKKERELAGRTNSGNSNKQRKGQDLKDQSHPARKGEKGKGKERI